MIPLVLPAKSEAAEPFVTRLLMHEDGYGMQDSVLVPTDDEGPAYSGHHGLLTIDGESATALNGDIVLVRPQASRVERLLRAGSRHNTLLVTEDRKSTRLNSSHNPASRMPSSA
jgi:hypothetical protein